MHSNPNHRHDGSDWPSYDTWTDDASPAEALEVWAEWNDAPEGLFE